MPKSTDASFIYMLLCPHYRSFMHCNEWLPNLQILKINEEAMNSFADKLFLLLQTSNTRLSSLIRVECSNLSDLPLQIKFIPCKGWWQYPRKSCVFAYEEQQWLGQDEKLVNYVARGNGHLVFSSKEFICILSKTNEMLAIQFKNASFWSSSTPPFVIFYRITNLQIF